MNRTTNKKSRDRHTRSWLQRLRTRRALPLFVFAVTFPFVITGALLAAKTFQNRIASWASPSSEARQNFDRFQSRFDTNDTLLVTWPGCELGNSQVAQIESKLQSEDAETFVKLVASGDSMYSMLRNDLKLSKRASLFRLRGSILGPDSKTTALIITLTEFGSNHRHQAIEFIRKTIIEGGVDTSEIRMAGPAYDIHEIDREGFWSPWRAIPVIVVVAFALTWIFVRQLRLTLFINAMSAYTACSALTVIYLTGTSLNAIIWTLPTLILLLTTSAALHFMGYYKNAANSSHEDPSRIALKHAMRPTFYCALTTAAGLFSLVVSSTAPVRQFGLFGGIAVMIACCLILTCLPVWLYLFPWQQRSRRIHNRPRRFWNELARFAERARVPIITIAVLGIAGLIFAIPNLRTSVNIRNFFPDQFKLVQDSIWIEENVCPLSSVELLLQFSSPSSDNDFDRMRLFNVLNARFKSEKFDGLIYGTLSPGTYAPTRRERAGLLRDAFARDIAEGRIEKLKADLPNLGFLHVDPESGDEIWRMSLRISNVKKTRLDQLVKNIEAETNEVFELVRNHSFQNEELSVECTGQAVILDEIESQFLGDLTLTYATAFSLISIVVLFLLRSFSGLVVASLPNLLPTVLVLGLTAAFGISLDVGSMMTASVALGIAVDDTLHFLLWWRQRIRQNWEPRRAMVDAMKHCGTAMVQTSVVCGFSVSLYMFCGFLPTVRFGLLLAAMLFAAILGDLLVLPALLSTRVARRLALITTPRSTNNQTLSNPAEETAVYTPADV